MFHLSVGKFKFCKDRKCFVKLSNNERNDLREPLLTAGRSKIRLT